MTRNTITKNILELLCEDFTIEKSEMMPDTLEEAHKIKKTILQDPAWVFGIIPLNEETYQFLLNHISNIRNVWKKCPDLNYKAESNEITISKYSTEYVMKMMNIAHECDAAIYIKTKKDYLLCIEVKYEDAGLEFQMVLAPRIDND